MEANSDLRARLRTRLRQELPVNHADNLCYHLSDLHEAFTKGARLIEQLASAVGSPEDVGHRRSVASLSGELIEHIPMHLRELAPDLEAWRNQLYAAAEERGEL